MLQGNGLSDVYTGGARGQAGKLFIQNDSGIFKSQQNELFGTDLNSEETDCAFFDATGNGVDDLYVVSGGNSHSSGSSALLDRFFINDGQSNFRKSNQPLPTTRGFEPGSVVRPHDFTGDGNMDLFVGIRLRPFAVGMPVNGYLLAGDGEGNFRDVTEEWAPELINSGMITDALWADITGNNSEELIIVGEWMPIKVFTKENNRFVEITSELGLENTTGWWNAIAAGDINGNGRLDLIGANHGRNSMFRAEKDYPVKMWVGDFAHNGMVEQILTTQKDGEYYPVALRHDLIEDLPHLREQFPDYSSYAGKSVQQIFTDEELSNSNELQARVLESAVIWNTENGMKVEPLPFRAQTAPMFGIHLEDLTGNGTPEIVMGGNLYNVKPQSGPYDAGRSVVISYENGQLQTISPEKSGLDIPGEIRGIKKVHGAGDSKYLMFSRYDDTLKIFSLPE